jgi:hypothetical protein
VVERDEAEPAEHVARGREEEVAEDERPRDLGAEAAAEDQLEVTTITWSKLPSASSAPATHATTTRTIIDSWLSNEHVVAVMRAPAKIALTKSVSVRVKRVGVLRERVVVSLGSTP